VRGTNVLFVPPGGWDAKKIRSLPSRHKCVSPGNTDVEKPMPWTLVYVVGLYHGASCVYDNSGGWRGPQ